MSRRSSQRLSFHTCGKNISRDIKVDTEEVDTKEKHGLACTGKRKIEWSG